MFLFLILLLGAGWLHAQAQVASFSVSSSSGCAPLSVNFTNTSSGASSYQWDFGNGNYSTLTNPQNVYILPGTYVVQLIAFGNGTSDTSSQLITATAGPQLAISVDSYQGCNGYTAFQFTCVSPDATNLSWDFGDGSTSSALNPQKVYNNPGTYSVSLLATNADGCQSVVALQQVITVIEPPQASYTVNNNETCDLQELFEFTAGSETTDTYNWDFGDGMTSSEMHPDHIFATSGIFTVELTMTNAFGCSDSYSVANLITVHPDNTPVISASVLSGCLPLASTLSSNVVGAVSYSWLSSDGQSATTPTFSVTYFPAGNYNINLSVVMPNGCSYSSPAPTVIQVNPKPVASFTAANTIGCAPLTVDLTNTSIGANSYYWTFGDGGYSFDADPVYSYPNPGEFVITLKAFNEFGCWRTMSVDSIIVTAPTIVATLDNTTGCPPLTIALTNTSENAISYLWDFGDGTTSTDAVPTHTYNDLGQYEVMLVAFGSGGCSDTLVFAGGVNVSAQLANYPTPPPLAGCAPFTTSFGLNDPNITSFYWSFGDGTTSTAAAPSHTYTTPGNYIVSLQINDGSICGLSYPVYQEITVEGITPEFAVTVEQCPPHLVHFTDTISDAVSWEWDFGDGTSSTLQNPTHIYPTTNNYHVGLTIVTSSGCERTFVGFNAVTFTDNSPSFTSSYDPADPFPTPVSFNAISIPGVTYNWDFGDGTSGVGQNPTHVYQNPGEYTVTLTINGNGCSISVSGEAFSTPSTSGGSGSGGSEPPITTIPGSPFISCAPASISFFRQSPSHQIIQWNFGDGTTSTVTNPVKIYTTPGIYNVSYLANTPSGQQVITYPQSVHIGGFMPNMLISTDSDCDNFYIETDLSNAALFDQVQWVFGTSTPINGVEVSYQTPLTNSSINIRVMVRDTLGCYAIRNQNILMDQPVPFVSYPTTVCRDSVRFQQLAGTNGLSFFWEFGDGETSNEDNPVHQYDSTGAYTVHLTIITDEGCSERHQLSPQIIFAAPRMDVIVNGSWDGCAPHALQVIYPGELAYVNFIYGDSLLSNTDTVNLAFSDTGIYSDFIMIATTTWINGCRDTVEFDPIHVYGAYADFSFTQDVNCLPVTAQFSDSSLDAAAWFWDFGDGITSNEQNPSLIYTTQPSDSVTLAIETAFGCRDTITHSGLTIFELEQLVNYTGACNPLMVGFTASSNEAAQFEWHLGNGEVVQDQSFVHTYTSDGEFTPYVVGTSTSGCRDTAFVATPILVSSIDAVFNSPSPAACAPSIVEFFDQSVGAVSWDWDFGDNSGSALQNPVKLYDSPGIYSISLVVTSAFGCQDTMSISDYITVLGPATSFTVSQMQESCVGVPLQFTDLSLDAVEWEWNFGEGTSSTEQHPVFSYAEPGSYVITLFSLDTVGCSAFYSIPVPYVIHGNPESVFTVAVDSGCTPFTPIFDNQSVGGVEFSWNFGDGSSLAFDSIPSHTYTIAGDYTVALVVKNNEGCYDTSLVEPLKSLLVPKATLSITEGTGCLPLDVTFDNLSSDLEYPSYQLLFSDTVAETNPDSIYTFNSPGFYSVSLIVDNLNGCSDTINYPSVIQVFDTIPPPVSEIMRVSVENDDSVRIEWTENFDPQFSHYAIHRKSNSGGSFSLLTSIYDPHTILYFDAAVDVMDSVYCYKVEAVDVCGRRLPFDSLIEHCTVNVQTITLQNNTIDISWTPYIGKTVAQYIILRTEENTNLVEDIGVVPGDSTHFVDRTVVCPVKYKYEIVATELGGLLHLQSDSDFDICDPIQNPFIHQFVNIGRSTVVDNSHILTEWAPPDTLLDKIVGYSIFRSTDGQEYELLADLPLNQTEYLDTDVNVEEVNYTYQVFARNICSTEAGAGVRGDNIVLEVKSVGELQHKLTWTPYLSWGNNGVGFYIIEIQKPDGTWDFLESVPGSVTTYMNESY
jgi:PKD repeat protein